MSRAGPILLLLAVLVFLASSLAYALAPSPPAPAVPGGGDAAALLHGLPSGRQAVDLPGLLLQPKNPGMMALLGLTWAALGFHAARRLAKAERMRQARLSPLDEASEAPPEVGPPLPRDMLQLHGRDDTLQEHGPLILGLLAGALSPWLLGAYPLTAFLLSALMLACFLAAALRGVREGLLVHRSSALGFVAGWGLLVCFAAFTSLLRDRLGAPQEVAAVIAMLIGSVAAVSVQLRMPKRIGFSVALIWGLIGIAANTVTTDAAIATVTVIAIAIIAVALVRVTT